VCRARFTRNPQYLGEIAATLGWAILTGSMLVWLTALPAVVWYLLLPRTEEPWLLARYGEDYRWCRDATPRFL
jgi:protein-S-isoprenylcysteine O-methyltransferase Ste14